nr:MAG TPA: hypothetical protein [Caudoviricetes sp.]
MDISLIKIAFLELQEVLKQISKRLLLTAYDIFCVRVSFFL